MATCIEGVRSEEAIKVKFNLHAWRKMLLYAKEAADSEISGLGIVSIKDGVPFVEDVFTVKQRASRGFVSLDQEAISKLITEKVSKGDFAFTGKLRMWWHSHCDGRTFHSGTDENTVRLLRQFAPWILSFVVNKQGDVDSCISLQTPIPITIKESTRACILV